MSALEPPEASGYHFRLADIKHSHQYRKFCWKYSSRQLTVSLHEYSGCCVEMIWNEKNVMSWITKHYLLCTSTSQYRSYLYINFGWRIDDFEMWLYIFIHFEVFFVSVILQNKILISSWKQELKSQIYFSIWGLKIKKLITM